MNIRELVLIFALVMPGYASGESAEAEFMDMKAGVLKGMFKEHTALETTANNTRRLLIRKSITGQEYGRYGRIYVFTEPGHPAHPSLMTVRLAEGKSMLPVQRQGVSARDEATFQKWLIESKTSDKADMEEILGRTFDSSASPEKGSAQVTGVSRELEEQIKARTYDYFSSKDLGAVEAAYAHLEQPTPGRFAEWRNDLISFNKTAGAVISREVKNVTWYRNPVGAPQGLYGAVDFESKFTHLNIHCGFVMWRVQPDGTLKLLSEEEGYIDKETQKKMAPSEIDAFKRNHLKCRTP